MSVALVFRLRRVLPYAAALAAEPLQRRGELGGLKMARIRDTSLMVMLWGFSIAAGVVVSATE